MSDQEKSCEDRGEQVRIQQLAPQETTCVWHAHNEEGKEYEQGEIVYGDTCPWLYHTLYPYFLGFHFGAKYHFNEDGDCNVGCPAVKGVDTIVRKVKNDPGADPRIEPDWRYLAYAEIIAVHGDCPYKHEVGQKILFTTGMPKHFMCPAGFHNVFPLLRLRPPSCIDVEKMRCPDYAEVVHFSIPRPEKRPGEEQEQENLKPVEPVLEG